jgi:hypothetical protein
MTSYFSVLIDLLQVFSSLLFPSPPWHVNRTSTIENLADIHSGTYHWLYGYLPYSLGANRLTPAAVAASIRFF